MDTQRIQLHRGAPPKPLHGAPCNGCGVCCASEPCPLGMVASLRRTGACTALRWHEAEQRYRCGLLAGGRGPVSRLAARWISAGSGCDCTLQVEPQAARGP